MSKLHFNESAAKNYAKMAFDLTLGAVIMTLALSGAVIVACMAYRTVTDTFQVPAVPPVKQAP